MTTLQQGSGIHDVLMRLAWTQFLEWLETNHIQHHQTLDETLRYVNDVHENPYEATLASLLNDETSQSVLDLFTIYMDDLRYNSGQQVMYMYLDLVELLFGLLLAFREGDWFPHLATIRKMIPWCFAADKTNYA
jgi:hypothetical protein